MVAQYPRCLCNFIDGDAYSQQVADAKPLRLLLINNFAATALVADAMLAAALSVIIVCIYKNNYNRLFEQFCVVSIVLPENI